jgi:DNA-binding transcriptional ArsR family regulator
MDEKLFTKYFKAFGDQSRLRILTLLTSGEKTVNDIAEKVKLSQPTVSRHLAILREAGIVTDRRDKQRVYYSINRQSVENCCSGFCDCLEIKVVDDKKCKKK